MILSVLRQVFCKEFIDLYNIFSSEGISIRPNMIIATYTDNTAILFINNNHYLYKPTRIHF